MPEVYRKANIVPRGVANRRAAINWIRKHAEKGVIYFGDDDNTFDLRLFDEIRDTKKVSMFPVGLIGDYAVSSPVLQEVLLHLHSSIRNSNIVMISTYATFYSLLFTFTTNI
jgi:3-deoxy-D-manno-octulosonate 8-phosphate phosphatase KdsC-like HAD superfamily phosphatase